MAEELPRWKELYVKLKTSMFDSLPVVVSYNEARGGVPVVFICETRDVAEREAKRLISMPHMLGAEVVDAVVKR